MEVSSSSIRKENNWMSLGLSLKLEPNDEVDRLKTRLVSKEYTKIPFS